MAERPTPRLCRTCRTFDAGDGRECGLCLSPTSPQSYCAVRGGDPACGQWQRYGLDNGELTMPKLQGDAR